MKMSFYDANLLQASLLIAVTCYSTTKITFGNVVLTAEMCEVNTSQSSFWDKMADTELCSHSNQISSFSSEEATEELKFRSRNNSTLSIASLEGKQVQQKSGKVARSSSGCSKRSRVAQMKEASLNEAEADDIKGMF